MSLATITDVSLRAARLVQGELVTYSRGSRSVELRVLRGQVETDRLDAAGEARLKASQAAFLIPAAELLLGDEFTAITPQLGDTIVDVTGLAWKVAPLMPGDPPCRAVDRCPAWLRVTASR